ncbi:hypothetical protein DAPPUDRAFT_229747 [Daphnia pulex]|uniref:mRNA guanylyltransferase n=1 Tax=Daphnia pulex TaxID=6669 RepID=E9HU22_DAPPU|nr:hypothetical protein DAPPUDRAFT_229747 [Daphnia pulex]|eukprot:EFX64761.1 hypothetical protein DAPPUDRAFT_229747 [Daphnia pulex]
MWPVSCPKKNAHHWLASKPYVVGPKPSGPRFLLYIDSSGDIFLENMTQHIFCIDEDHTIKIKVSDGRTISDTLLDGIITREKLNGADARCNGKETTRKLTFVILDAIRCSGNDLTGLNILERLAFVKGYKSEINYDAFKWLENDVHKCCFRLKVPKGVGEPKVAELHMLGPYRSEIKYDTIKLTEEIKKLDGCIIDCRYFEHQWIFITQRHDRNHPNGRRAIMGKMEALENAVSRDLLLATLENSRGLE